MDVVLRRHHRENGSLFDHETRANLWHELDDEAGVLGEVKRLIRPGGRLAILDWRGDVVSPPGPPVAHRVPLDTLRQVLSRHGWSVTYAGNVGLYSYLIIAGLEMKPVS